MLVTIPWAISLYFGRVDIVDGSPVYKPKKGKPKVTPDLFLSQTLDFTCASITNAMNEGGRIMTATTLQVT